MRPSLLDPFFAPVTALPGIGPKLAAAYDRLLGDENHPARLLDLLFHLPHGAIDRRPAGRIADAPTEGIVTFVGRVAAHRPSPPGKTRAPYRVTLEDDSGDVTLVFFHGDSRRMQQLLPVGEERYVSGRIELYDGRRQMVHPDRVLDARGFAQLPSIEPVYGQTEGLTARMIGKAAQVALARLPELPEWQDTVLVARQDLPPFREALSLLHAPPDVAAVQADTLARRRLAYDELFASQLALALLRQSQKRQSGRVNAGDGGLVKRILAALPFSLTDGQHQAVADIRADLAKPERMLRLLQGDVGSGKTIVALLAMVSAVEAGRQAALLAPTDLLARQHAARLAPLVAAAGLEIAVLTGRDKGAERHRILTGLAQGTIHLVVGTHAIFQDAVNFADLGLAVIDEQHRFGVHQRLRLGAKGDGVDILVMTATPIPRTLALSYFGDMDVSVLRDKPAGRQPVQTRLVSLDRYDEVAGSLGRALAAGARVYWVCPLVSEHAELDLAAAEERAAALRELYGPEVVLLHGQMAAKERDAAMARFASGEARILVATTVIEVGVDVPEATIMVIEHAERFGLAQLHQLRGRIGRGAGASTCLLLYKGPLGAVAEARLSIMRETEDGFRIAEEDLKLRGEGEILGTRQAGAPDFRIARLETDGALMAMARDDARLLCERDPDLTSPRGQAARLALYLFERDMAVRLLRAG